MIAQFLKKRAERAAKKRHQSGYDYAAGALLATRGAVEVIRDLEVEADGIFGRDEFEHGMLAALRDWQEVAHARRNYERLEAIATFAQITPIHSPSDAQRFKSRVEDMARGAP